VRRILGLLRVRRGRASASSERLETPLGEMFRFFCRFLSAIRLGGARGYERLTAPIFRHVRVPRSHLAAYVPFIISFRGTDSRRDALWMRRSPMRVRHVTGDCCKFFAPRVSGVDVSDCLRTDLPFLRSSHSRQTVCPFAYSSVLLTLQNTHFAVSEYLRPIERATAAYPRIERLNPTC
jgi:hypothetical protein